MGMFDEIRCHAPLPDGYDASDVWFQNKSFPDCCLCRYTITRNGRLIDSDGNDLEPDGYLSFYTTDPVDKNIDDQRSQWREYRARFQQGQLQDIKRVPAGEVDRYYYYGLASFRWFASPSFMFTGPGDGAEDDPADSV